MISVLEHLDLLTTRESGLFIGNRWQSSENGGQLAHVNPASGEEVARIAEATREDVSRAVGKAREAFDAGPWPRMKARERIAYLRRIEEGIRANADRLNLLQSLDNAIPTRFAARYRTSANFAADLFDHFAGWVDKISGGTHPVYTDELPVQALTFREPKGVVAALTPSNAPLLQVPNKIAPALACGCVVVLKPSEVASLVAVAIAEIIAECDLPEGVFQMVTGSATTGEALVADTRVDQIAFTGSEAVGAKILAASADGMRRTFLELGGKSAAVVFPDCDVAQVAHQLMANCSTFLSGQICSIPTRAVVHKSVYREFVDAASRQLDEVQLGDPFNPETTSAPLITPAARARVEQSLSNLEGGTLVLGGGRPNGELSEGNWLNPALVMDVAPDSQIFREELFGPVLSITPFDTEDEAIALANHSRYGLGGMVFTQELDRGWRVARAIRTGTIGLNAYSFFPNSPFGGLKASGMGREGGIGAIEAYTELKTIMFPVAGTGVT